MVDVGLIYLDGFSNTKSDFHVISSQVLTISEATGMVTHARGLSIGEQAQVLDTCSQSCGQS